MNEEFLVMAVHQTAMNTFLPFVHTARRFYRLNDPMRILDVPVVSGVTLFPGGVSAPLTEVIQVLLFRGRKSRNKVTVGEPAVGSLG